MLHLAPDHVRGQVFGSVFRSSSSPFGALAARPCSHSLAPNDLLPLPGAGMDFTEVHIHPTFPCEGAWACCQLVQQPALCTGPGKSSCRYGWVGDSASTVPKLFPLPPSPAPSPKAQPPNQILWLSLWALTRSWPKEAGVQTQQSWLHPAQFSRSPGASRAP